MTKTEQLMIKTRTALVEEPVLHAERDDLTILEGDIYDDAHEHLRAIIHAHPIIRPITLPESR